MPGMWRKVQSQAGWVVAGCGLALAGTLLMARAELNRLRDAFETDARIVHRLLSQRVVQHDAVMATLALLQPEGASAEAGQRLPSVYPQILSVQRRERGTAWADARLQAAELQSRTVKRPALAQTDLPQGRYSLVLAADPASFALQFDLRAVIPWSEWPMAPDTSPVRVTLEHSGQVFVVQPGRVVGTGWQFDFHKHLAADSQPFDVVVARSVGWAALPWAAMGAWSAVVAAALLAVRAWLRQREQRQRAEELLRLGQVARLNTLGELAAGMAHELNQPLTAVLANAQAAQRLLADDSGDPVDLDTAREAMAQAVQQARRASEVVQRLRRVVERPDPAAGQQSVDLHETVRNALHLLEPELQRRSIRTEVQSALPGLRVLADPVALEQIVHNLVMNALQAMEQVPVGERRLTLQLRTEAALGELDVQDTGPGFAPDLLQRLFQPFVTTRSQGLGLGLSLCETLAVNMGGTLTASNRTPRGASLRLRLPLDAA